MTKKSKNTPPAEKTTRGPNATSFSTEHPSPAAFEAGISPNPGGKPREFRALARALRAQGAGRASDAECAALGLPTGSSKVQVAAERVLWTMRRGTPSEQLAASELFARLTGEYTSRVALGFDPDMTDEEGSLGGPRLIVNFVSSRSDIERKRQEGKILDAQPLSAHDPDPASLAAREEAARAAPHGELPLAPAAPPPAPKPAPKQLPPAPRPQSLQEVRLEAYRRSGLKV